MENSAVSPELFKQCSILVVDDDVVALNYLAKILSLYFKNVYQAQNGEEGVSIALSTPIDIILTDYKMPIKDGADFIEEIREKMIHIPVVFMSAHKDPDMLIKIIPLYINEYILKPLNIQNVLEVLAQALDKNKVLLETKQNISSITLEGSVVVDIENKIVRKDDNDILLTKKEFELLELFILNRQSTLTKEQIEQSLWINDIVTDSSVKSLIKKLRDKIGHEAIQTVTNVGYSIKLKQAGE